MSWAARIFGENKPSTDSIEDWDMLASPDIQAESIIHVKEDPEPEELVMAARTVTRERDGFVLVGEEDGYSISIGTLVTVIAIPVLACIGWFYVKDFSITSEQEAPTFLPELSKQPISLPELSKQLTPPPELSRVDASVKKQFRSLFSLNEVTTRVWRGFRPLVSFFKTDSLVGKQIISLSPFYTENSLAGRQAMRLFSSNEVTTRVWSEFRPLVFLD